MNGFELPPDEHIAAAFEDARVGVAEEPVGSDKVLLTCSNCGEQETVPVSRVTGGAWVCEECL